MADTGKIGAALRRVLEALDEAQNAAAQAGARAQQVQARAERSGFRAIAGGMRQVIERLRRVQQTQSDLANCAKAAANAVPIATADRSPATVVATLAPVIHQLDTLSTRMATVVTELDAAKTDVEATLKGGNPRPMLAALGAIERALSQLASSLADARQCTDETIVRAREIGEPDSDGNGSASRSGKTAAPTNPDSISRGQDMPVRHDIARIERARALARDDADRAQQAGRRRGTAESLVSRDGQEYVADSGREFPVYDREVRAIIDTVPVQDREPWHGYCSLAQCVEEALNDDVDPTGAWVGSAAIRAEGNRSHGKHVPPCSSCQPLFDHYQLKEAK